MTDSFATWKARTDERIAATLRATSDAVRPAGPSHVDLTAPLISHSRGGKRLRALLLLSSYVAHGGDDDDVAIEAAAALELFQTAALLHDDVLDDSDMRRGKPAAHRVIAGIHRNHGWSGDSDSYGAAGGILAGDLALMACQRSLVRATSRLTPGTASTVGELFSDMADLVTAGQYADMRAAAQPLDALADQEQEIVSVMRSKTASYTAEHPLGLGAALAGASAERVATMRDAGVELGIAFQVRDDLLGLTGSPAVTGKPAGDDVREGKRTLVLWRAWTTTDDHGRARIARALGNRTASDHDVADAVATITSTDAVAWCEAQVAERAAAARSGLASADLDARGAGLINALIDRAVARSA
ncbi:polyprenyl synthetase family protein [uncultured Demequina sp.]|uniref:polyprenyl synthetase family protein n=1 Tax=uncultured Demequina sp. TaxID=693499 RepID=UPI0025CFBF17|nr:polyprenyl synthetase family protein [uncultured Demequina sp.]